MKKRFKLTDLDCANCAAKMETGINQLPGVNKASISFMTSKLVIDADTEDAEAFAAIVDGDCDDIPEQCFRYAGTIDEVRKRYEKLLKDGQA